MPSWLIAVVDQEIGRDQPLRPGGAHPAKLAVELTRILRKPAEIGFGVRAIVDRVVGVEELRRVDVGADVLDHDIGRVAPATDGNVAIGQGKALKRRSVGALHHFDAGASREGKGARVDRLGRARSALSVAATRACPAADRSSSCSDMRPSAPCRRRGRCAAAGWRRSRLSANESSSALPALRWPERQGRTSKATAGRRSRQGRRALRGG